MIKFFTPYDFAGVYPSDMFEAVMADRANAKLENEGIKVFSPDGMKRFYTEHDYAMKVSHVPGEIDNFTALVINVKEIPVISLRGEDVD
jgi:hypothetical protein